MASCASAEESGCDGPNVEAADQDVDQGASGSDHEIELEVAESGRDVKSYKYCKKNPGHHQFVAIQDFGVHNLDNVPKYLSKEVVKEYVLSWAVLTVRISMKFVSDQRPDKPYPMWQYRGRRVCHTGSGWVQHVVGPEEGPCRCRRQCTQKKSTNNKFWGILVRTARHVVFDDSEARECELVLFDDSDDKSGIHTLTGHEVFSPNTEHDFSHLWCFTCDENLAGRLEELCDRCDDMCEEMEERAVNIWKSGKFEVDSTSTSRQRLTELCKRTKEIETNEELIKNDLGDQGMKILTSLKQRLLELLDRVRDMGGEVDVSTRETVETLTDVYYWEWRGIRHKVEDVTNRLYSYSTTTTRQTVTDATDKLHSDSATRQTLLQLCDSLVKLSDSVDQIEAESARQHHEIEESIVPLVQACGGVSRPVYVISHPHACRKYITTGHAKAVVEVKSAMFAACTYTSATCRGSSGGLVLILPNPVDALVWREAGCRVFVTPQMGGKTELVYYMPLPGTCHSSAVTRQVGRSVTGISQI